MCGCRIAKQALLQDHHVQLEAELCYVPILWGAQYARMCILCVYNGMGALLMVVQLAAFLRAV
jgi:hypothetical protein